MYIDPYIWLFPLFLEVYNPKYHHLYFPWCLLIWFVIQSVWGQRKWDFVDKSNLYIKIIMSKSVDRDFVPWNILSEIQRKFDRFYLSKWAFLKLTVYTIITLCNLCQSECLKIPLRGKTILFLQNKVFTLLLLSWSILHNMMFLQILKHHLVVISFV